VSSRRRLGAIVACVLAAALPAGADARTHRRTSKALAAGGAQVPLWSDEFTGPAGAAPDPARWTAELGGNGWGNQELQTYTGAASNAALDGAGRLAITARRETVTGADGIARDFTSARLMTKGHFTFRYGRVEARIRVPAGRGLLAQFWAVGDDVWTAGWPESGEIDVMEVLGERPATVVGSLHGPLDGGAPYAAWARSTETTASRSLAAGFHTYSAQWSPTSISMALDGRTYATYPRSVVPAAGRWVFDKPFFLVLDVAVGGVWAGAPDASTPWPATMLVDSVRVYAAR
jgi:beta-glucanase (GH16 family)